MNMKIIAIMAIAILACASVNTYAAPAEDPSWPVFDQGDFLFNIEFARITNNNPDNSQVKPSQLVANAYLVEDTSGSIITEYVMFEFINRIPSNMSGSVTDIYFDNGMYLDSFVSVDNTHPDVRFEAFDKNNISLPAGSTINPIFEADSHISADVVQNTADGLNEVDGTDEEWVRLVYQLKTVDGSVRTHGEVYDGFNSGEIRIGLHVRAMANGSSETYVSMWDDIYTDNPTLPEPSTIVMFALGGLLILCRRSVIA